MHSLKAIHDSRRTRSLPHSRLTTAVSLLNTTNNSPTSSGINNTYRLSSGLVVAGRGAPGRNRGHVNAYWAAKGGAGKTGEERARSVTREEEGERGAISAGDTTATATMQDEVEERDGDAPGAPEEAKDATTDVETDSLPRRAEPRRTSFLPLFVPLIFSQLNLRLTGTDSSDYELVRGVSAVIPLDDISSSSILTFDRIDGDEDDWELLALDEEDALRLGYQPAVVREDSKTPWASSVVVSPVGA